MKKNNNERNKFIYENREMSRKQLAELVNQKFESELMDFDLPTIINSERKKILRDNKKR